MPTTQKSLDVKIRAVKSFDDVERLLREVVRKIDEAHRKNRSDMEALEARVAALEAP